MQQHPDITKITNLLDAQSSKLAAHGHRQIVILSGSLEWTASLAISILASTQKKQEMTSNSKSNCAVTSKGSALEEFINNLATSSNISIARPEKPNTLLGHENSHVIFDAHSGFNPDALCAVSGTIKAGGFLILLTPELSLWANKEDSFAKKRLSYGNQQPATSPQTIKRFLNIALPLGAIYIDEHHSFETIEETINTANEVNQTESANTLWSLPLEATSGQKQILQSIIHDAQHHLFNTKHQNKLESTTEMPKRTKSFHIIQADRGRGKSHLLGLIANEILNLNIDNGIKLIITAPNKLSTQTVYNSYASNLKQTEHPKPLKFVAPENILTEGYDAQILIVDEAASLPIPLLKQWAQHFEFIIFATTTHGYEGTGKGFQVRFLDFLTSLKQTIHQHSLNQPIRYNHDDPVETTLFKTFCLDSEPAGLNLNTVNSNQVKQQEVSQRQLNNKPQLLEEVFSLLVQAHYQTRPSDLRDILDAPGLRVFISYKENLNDPTQPQTVLAACLVFDEGNLSIENKDIIDAICEGTRRPKGHLTPQVLTLHMGQENALYLKGARIVRIATLPNLQRLSLGSTLLNFVESTLGNDNYDYISSSYADTEDVREFWLKNAFSLIRLGSKLDQASGTHSGLVIKALSKTGSKLTSNCLSFFSNQKRQTRNYDEITATEKILVRYFIENTGSYEAIKDILSRNESWRSAFSAKGFPKKANRDFRKQVEDWTKY